MVIERASLHQDKLLKNWNLTQQQQAPEKIDLLK
jgi:hypothetical protein